jgi:putative Mn2+ efflux pump MntP
MGIEIITLLMISLGLSMDAFAVSISNGLCYSKTGIKRSFYIALTFALYQGIMAVLGYYLGSTALNFIKEIGYILAFIILAAIGGKMVFEAVKEKENIDGLWGEQIKFGQLMMQGIATSIDSLIVGFGFAVLSVNILYASLTIASVTFAVCFAGVLIGKRFGGGLKKKAVLSGGIILILIGIKILLENLI